MNWEIFFHESVIFAMIGGLIGQLLILYESFSLPEKNKQSKSSQRLGFLLFPVIGGLLVLIQIYPDGALEPSIAFNMGIAAVGFKPFVAGADRRGIREGEYD